MSVISMQDYLKIANNYGNARNQVLSSVQYLFDAVYDVVMLQGIIPEVDLLNEFYNSYQLNSVSLQSPTTMLSAVRTLNNHILNRGGFLTIDSFLLHNDGANPSENSTNPATAAVAAAKVSQGWADLSSAAGFTINPLYVVS